MGKELKLLILIMLACVCGFLILIAIFCPQPHNPLPTLQKRPIERFYCGIPVDIKHEWGFSCNCTTVTFKDGTVIWVAGIYSIVKDKEGYAYFRFCEEKWEPLVPGIFLNDTK